MLATTPTLASSVEEAQRHPLWELQVELERGMLLEGADSVRDRVLEAKRRGQMTRLTEVRHLVTDWLPKVATTLADWARTVEFQRGPKPIALPLIKALDYKVSALIGLRTVLDGLTVGRPYVTAVAIAIGKDIEHEQQVRLWEKREPKLFRATQKRLEKDRATAHHRGVVNIHTFNKLLNEGVFEFGWQKWSQEDHFRVGIEIINAVVRVTGWFTIEEDPFHTYSPKRGMKGNPRAILAPVEGLADWLGKTLDAAELMSPAYKPTVIPPKRWEGTRNGGYWTPYVKTPRLIRFKASQETQKDRAADEYDALNMPEVYDSVHFLQEVPWRINQRVFAVMEEVAARDLRIGGVPVLSAEGHPLPQRPEGMPPVEEREASKQWLLDNPEPARMWKRAAKEVYKRNAELFSKQTAFNRTLRIAKEYGQYAQFYFPHMLDFRGRIYPIPVALQPQGDDLARGLLEFAEGKAVENHSTGAYWMALSVATHWGNDKVSFDERVEWVLANEDLWRRIAGDPLGNLEWAELHPKTGKPVRSAWQALAAIFDWVGLLDAVNEDRLYVSHMPVSVDGTCNGIQHLAAMTKDEVAGAYVNLVPGDKPRDIYAYVARKLQDKVERISQTFGEPAEHATYWLEVTNGAFPRGLTKRQVMVLPYGASKEAYFTYTREWLDEEDPLPDNATSEDWSARGKRIVWLGSLMWDTVHEEVEGPMEIMRWLRQCADHAAGANQPIFWKVPTGFIVRHFYGKQATKNVTVKLSGQRTTLTLNETTQDLDKTFQLRGIPPNFVHSQDAAALTLSINRARDRGITAFTSVHDAYGTHAADMASLADILREAFVKVHAAEPLVQFRNACMAVLAGIIMERDGLEHEAAWEKADETLPPLPEMGALDVRDVLRSPYFFA